MNLISRRNEGVMMITQNNQEESLTLLAMNDYLRELLGYGEEEKTLALNDILSHSTKKIIGEDIEYEGDARDLLEVLSRHRHIRLQHKNGRELIVEFRIMREMARDRHHMFRLVVNADNPKKDRRTIAQALKDGFNGHEVIDDVVGLPDVHSMYKNITLADSFLAGKDVYACFVYIKLEQYEAAVAAGNTTLDALIAHVGSVIGRNLRADDTVGRIADDALGVILVDVNPETVHMALSRIPHMVTNDMITLQKHGVRSLKLRQACVIIGNIAVDRVIATCEHLLEEDPERDMVMWREKSYGFSGVFASGKGN